MKASEFRKLVIAFFGAAAMSAGGFGGSAIAGDDDSLSGLLSDIGDGGIDDAISAGVGDDRGGGNIEIKKGKFGNVEITAPNAEISEMLQYLSSHFNVNIISTRNVSGKVNVNIRDLNMKDSLTAILEPNGWTFVEKGKFIYVYTKDELKEIEEANRKMVTHVYKLNYLTSGDASKAIKMLLTKSGSTVATADITPGFVPSEGGAGENSYAMTDVLVIRDYEENVEEAIALIKELDVAPVQVLIEVTVLRVALTETNAFGVDMSVLFDIDFNGITAPLDPIADLVDGTSFGDGGAAQTGFGQIAKSGGAKIGILTKNVAMFIRAVDEVNDTTVMAHPKILALNRMAADLHVGLKLGYQSTTTSSTNTTQDVKFIETGIKLNVRPFVSHDGHIRLELKPSLSDGTTRDTAAGTIPDTNVQELTTNVLLRNGQTIVLGGLFKEDIVTDRKQVPGLGNVPIIKHAFRGQDDSVKRSEIIFIVKATIVKDKAMNSSANQAMESIRLRRLGAREGLLPWSREKMSSSHLREAYMASDKGDTRRAQWHIDMALNINPVYVEARRMKEELSGKRGLMPNNSILIEVVDGIINDRINALQSLKNKTSKAKKDNAVQFVTIISQKKTVKAAGKQEAVAKLKSENIKATVTAKATGKAKTKKSTEASFDAAAVTKKMVAKLLNEMSKVSTQEQAEAIQATAEDDIEDFLGSDR